MGLKQLNQLILLLAQEISGDDLDKRIKEAGIGGSVSNRADIMARIKAKK